MQENEFEKQLKNAMEDFNLSPSAPVWEKVKKKLDEKKRRRLPFFFLLAAGLIAAGYFIYYVSAQHPQSAEKIAADNNNTTQKTNLQDSTKITNQKNLSKQNIHDTSLKSIQKSLHYNLDMYSKEKVVKQTNSDIVINKNTPTNKKNVKTNNKNIKQSVRIKNQNQKADNIGLNNVTIQQSSIITQPFQTSHDSSAAQQNMKEDERNNVVSLSKDSITTAKNIEHNISKRTTKNVAKNYKNPSWKFGITASYGRSKLTEKINRYNTYAPQYLNSVVGGITTPAAIVSNEHPFSSSNAYSVGAVIQKKVFKNGYISSGLNFTHLSVSSNVNRKIDSLLTVSTANDINSYYAVNGYYQAGSLKVYTSNYNFIEIPVSFQQYIFQSKQTSLSYNAGFSMRELLSSNALIYNPNSNVYFSKNDVFQKTQFQLLAGLNVEINTGKNNSIFIGPQISYSLSNLAKNKNTGSFHFINYGLQAGFLLHKK